MNTKSKDIGTEKDKLKELFLLISERSEGDEYFGSTKLNKLLFFTDFLAYLYFGNSITGHQYEAKPEGPMLIDFYNIRSQMESVGEIAVKQKDFWGFNQHRTFALRNADISLFTAEEIDLITRVIAQYRDFNASQISALSHDFLGWQAVNFGEKIPYETALISTRELTEEEIELPCKLEIKLPDDIVEDITSAK